MIALTPVTVTERATVEKFDGAYSPDKEPVEIVVRERKSRIFEISDDDLQRIRELVAAGCQMEAIDELLKATSHAG